jgi:ribosome modulation factor
MSQREPLIVGTDGNASIPFKGPQLGAYEKGQRAAHNGLTKNFCPYICTRGRFRTAWMQGFDSVKPRAKAVQS